MNLQYLNTAPEGSARAALLACCGSSAWTQRMLANRPFVDPLALHSTAEEIWSSLAQADFLEAFAKHPKIGARTSGPWSAEEQVGMLQSNAALTASIRDLNDQYEHKFGWIFIVCASGKSANEMRALLEARLNNQPDAELQTAAAEQAKIMHLRLDKLLVE